MRKIIMILALGISLVGNGLAEVNQKKETLIDDIENQCNDDDECVATPDQKNERESYKKKKINFENKQCITNSLTVGCTFTDTQIAKYESTKQNKLNEVNITDSILAKQTSYNQKKTSFEKQFCKVSSENENMTVLCTFTDEEEETGEEKEKEKQDDLQYRWTDIVEEVKEEEEAEAGQ